MQNINFKQNALWSVGLLIIPLIASFFIQGFNWSMGDYVIASLFFFVAGVFYQYFLFRAKNTSHKIWTGLGLTFLFVYIWAELAVGIFTNLGS